VSPSWGIESGSHTPPFIPCAAGFEPRLARWTGPHWTALTAGSAGRQRGTGLGTARARRGDRTMGSVRTTKNTTNAPAHRGPCDRGDRAGGGRTEHNPGRDVDADAVSRPRPAASVPHRRERGLGIQQRRAGGSPRAQVAGTRSDGAAGLREPIRQPRSRIGRPRPGLCSVRPPPARSPRIRKDRDEQGIWCVLGRSARCPSWRSPRLALGCPQTVRAVPGSGRQAVQCDRSASQPGARNPRRTMNGGATRAPTSTPRGDTNPCSSLSKRAAHSSPWRRDRRRPLRPGAERPATPTLPANPSPRPRNSAHAIPGIPTSGRSARRARLEATSAGQ